MKRKNLTRNALVTSIISMLLCVSMLVGTTFAWFTDEVTSGMNTIAAGNLDVELNYSKDAQSWTSVSGTTQLFTDVDGNPIELWEPGMVAYTNLQVINAGTLALKYQMSLNFGNENNLNGHKLSEVLKVVILDAPIAAGATRESVLTAAKAAAAKNQGLGALNNFYLTGALAAGASSEVLPVVIYWAPNDNAVDNLYNANNGKATSDGKPLHIEFGVNLQATQQMSEGDSFGTDYDQLSSILPKATVNSRGPETVPVYMGYTEDELALDASFQFLPNETLDEAQASDYRYWHADYVIKADRNVPDGTMALAGYYKAWCGDNGYVVLTNDGEDIAAGTEIRLVEMLGVTVNYEEICQYGNDGIGFKCGAADLTGVNAGTTITVELRMYETEAPSEANGNSHNVETGNFEVIGRTTYTFPPAPVTSNEGLQAALTSGDKDIDLAAGTYTLPNADLKEGVTLNCAPGTVFEGAKLNINGATIIGATFSGTPSSNTVNGTYKNCTFTGSNALRSCYAGKTVVFENCVFSGDLYGVHFDGGKNPVIFRNCTFSGFNTFGAEITKLTLENCTFKANGKSGYNGINLWGDTELTNCTFVFDGTAGTEWVDLSSSNQTVTFTKCTVTDGTNTTPIEEVVGNYGDNNTIIINGVTVNIPNMT